MGCASGKATGAADNESVDEHDQPFEVGKEVKFSEPLETRRLSVFTRMQSPVMPPNLRPKLFISWVAFQTRFDAVNGVNTFSYIIYKHKNVFLLHFKDYEEISNLFDVPEASSPYNSVSFPRHLNLVRRVLDFCVKSQSNNDWEDAIPALKRLGALHAESNINFDEMNLFLPSFLWALDQCQPKMSKQLRDIWVKLVQFVLYNICLGLTDHYDKVYSILETDDFRSQGWCCKRPASVPCLRCLPGSLCMPVFPKSSITRKQMSTLRLSDSSPQAVRN